MRQRVANVTAVDDNKAIMMGIIVKLSFAVFWLFFGATILIAEYNRGQPLVPRPFDISLGWWCILLSLYNWIRFALTWAFQQRRPRPEPEGIPTTLRPQHLGQLRTPDGEPLAPDPNPQITEKPPPPIL